MSSPIAECLQRHMAARAARTPMPSATDRRRLTGSHAEARRMHRRSVAYGAMPRIEDTQRLWPHARTTRRRDRASRIDLSVFRAVHGPAESSRVREAISCLAAPFLAACLVFGSIQPATASEPARKTTAGRAEAPLLPVTTTTTKRATLWSAVYVKPLPAAPATASARRHATRDTGRATPASASASVPAAVAAANQIRSRHGLQAFRHSPRLDEAAARHARWMLRTGKFSHSGENGSRVQHRIQATGYQACYGAENLAKGPPSLSVVMDAWMKSPGHRRNLLSKRGADMGLAMVRDAEGRPYWAMVVGTPCA